MPAASNATEYLGLVDDVLKPLQRQTPDDDQRYEFFAVNGESRPLYIAQAPPNTSVDALV